MNEPFLRNLTDAEFLSHVELNTDLERMLAERLREPEADAGEIEDLRGEVHEAEVRADGAEYELEEAEATLMHLRAYAKKLHAELSMARPDSELLADDDCKLLEG